MLNVILLYVILVANPSRQTVGHAFEVSCNNVRSLFFALTVLRALNQQTTKIPVVDKLPTISTRLK